MTEFENGVAEESRTSAHSRFGDLAVALSLIAAALIALAGSYAITGHAADDPIGPSLLPRIYAGVVVVGGLVVLGLVYARKTATPAAEQPGPGIEVTRWRPIAVSAALVAYVALLPLITYIPATLAFGVVMMVLLGARRIVAVLVFPAGMTFVVYLLFTHLLSVRLP